MEKISEWFKEENDYFYNKGKNLGIQLEKENKDNFFVINLIEGTDFSTEKIASLAGVSVEFVEIIRKELKEKKN